MIIPYVIATILKQPSLKSASTLSSCASSERGLICRAAWQCFLRSFHSPFWKAA